MCVLLVEPSEISSQDFRDTFRVERQVRGTVDGGGKRCVVVCVTLANVGYAGRPAPLIRKQTAANLMAGNHHDSPVFFLLFSFFISTHTRCGLDVTREDRNVACEQLEGFMQMNPIGRNSRVNERCHAPWFVVGLSMHDKLTDGYIFSV